MLTRTRLATVLIVMTMATPRVASADNGQGDDDQAGGQVGRAPWFPYIDDRVEPEETFELNTLAVVRVGDEGWRVNRGKYRSLLSRHDFYVTIGRTDLAQSEDSAARLASIIRLSGFAGIAIGGGLFYAKVSSGGLDPGFTPILAFTAGGALAVFVSTFISGPTVLPSQAEEMADRYNGLLKRHIERTIGDPKPKPMQAFRPRFIPWACPGSSGGAGLMAIATF